MVVLSHSNTRIQANANKVKDLTNHGGTWDTMKLHQIYNPNIEKEIANMPLSRHGEKDKIIWDIGNLGDYMAKEGYKLITRQGTPRQGQTLN